MTRFWRDGFWRTGRYGVPHWVSGHWVECDDWDRFGGTRTPADYWRAQLDTIRARGSSAARYVDPNATCPICGDDVFFYQNEHGSRVYFDDLGPPWPKHPCTDNPAPPRPGGHTASAGPQAPCPRGDGEIERIHAWIEAAYVYPDSRFAGRHGHKPWSLAELLMRKKGVSGTFFVLRDLRKGASRKLFMRARPLPRVLREGALVAVERGQISFLDPSSLEPREISVVRFRSAAAFIDAMLDPGLSG
jgi:hypothetical protein